MKKIREKREREAREKAEFESIAKLGARKISHEEQLKLNKLFGVPDSPINVCALGRTSSAAIWLSLEPTATAKIDPIVEVSVADSVFDFTTEDYAPEPPTSIEWYYDEDDSNQKVNFDGTREVLRPMEMKIVVRDTLSKVIVGEGIIPLKDLMQDPEEEEVRATCTNRFDSFGHEQCVRSHVIYFTFLFSSFSSYLPLYMIVYVRMQRNWPRNSWRRRRQSTVQM